jgi:hypothetical protein
LCRELGVDERTLARWRAWWQEEVPRTDYWVEIRAHLDRPLDECGLPISLLERVEGASEEARLLRFLRLLLPASHSGLMRTRFARVA